MLIDFSSVVVAALDEEFWVVIVGCGEQAKNMLAKRENSNFVFIIIRLDMLS